MTISSRFAVGIHILTLLELNKEINTSETIAGSVNTNPALIRKIIGMLKKADLVEVHPGKAGAKLKKGLAEITLLDVYQAVEVVSENELFSIHDHPNPDCFVGKNIQQTIEPIFISAQLAMEKVLLHVTLEDVVKEIDNK
ncbi:MULTISPECIES: Rrf2 family transcriptional regulator [Cytobacillus]|uniref:Rrf2 family transcriptional regulator n=1 Tax=Cytobacillus stercorigallinarum TaxID=2762240 RepID=A0ABR8QSY7_9BACI|nr:Rrf2 family transcriptional regulator [Cytobacillus stercorigallinarum]MBD7938658.1 Rrf2 family transcriptional regulator [Cytobacillus stercorigallinarum]